MFILEYINWLFVKSGAKVQIFRHVVNITTFQKTIKDYFRHKILFWNKSLKKIFFELKFFFPIY